MAPSSMPPSKSTNRKLRGKHRGRRRHPVAGEPSNKSHDYGLKNKHPSTGVTPASNRSTKELRLVLTRIPMTPLEAIKYYGSRLSEYERNEIHDYDEIWYLGLDACKIHGTESLSQNLGFDDDNGSYYKIVRDHICYRYEIIEVIGKGSFGQVIKALDHKTNQHVAIKIIRNKKEVDKIARYEMRILDHLRKIDQGSSHNIVNIMDYFYFRNHHCIVFELLDLNLYEMLKCDNYRGISLAQIRKFTQCLVECLRFLKSENIIHCDLKPENILLKERGSTSIKVIDFGSSCYADQRVYTYIQSRFYRSPEVLLGLPYGHPIDMWSLGCILAELHTGEALFPGENEVEQLALIVEVIGLPPENIKRESRRMDLVGSAISKRLPGTRSIASAIRSNDKLFVDFISQCLRWDPKKRLTPEKALHHGWLKSKEGSRQSPSLVPLPVRSMGSRRPQ